MLDVTNFVCSLRISSNTEQMSILKNNQPKKESHPLGKMFF